MQRRSVVAGIALVVGILVMVGHARAQDDSPYPIDLKVGETFDVCASGLIRCPAIGNHCHDQKVAIPVSVIGSGVGFRGVGPGTTLCVAGSHSESAAIFRITVR